MGKVAKAVLMAKPLKQMVPVTKLMQQAQEGLVRKGGSRMADHTEMTAMFGGTEVGLAVGAELTMSEQIRINTKP